MTSILFDNYFIEKFSFEEFIPFLKKNREVYFKNENDFNSDKLLDIIEEDKIKELRKRINFTDNIFYCYKIYSNDIVIGWTFSKQTDDSTIYMINSTIFPEYRNNGIYSKVLEFLIIEFEKDGFQKIKSNHKMNNNPIIIPKLKKGFFITGINVTENFGTVLELTYVYNKKRAKLFNYRLSRIKQDLSNLLNL